MPIDAPPAPFGSTFRALRHRNFRLYWSGQLISLIGTWMQSVAQGWLMHRLTSSALMLGLLGFAQFLPVMLLSLWAGVVVDRMDKRRLLLWTQSLLLLQATALATLVSLNLVQPWMILVMAFAFGAINAFDLPARQSFLIELVGRADLSNGIALNSAAFNAARVLGPAVAGILLGVLGEAGCFWINAVSYVAVLIGLARITLPPFVVSGTLQTIGTTLAEGVRYALGDSALRNLLVLLGLTAGLGFQYTVLLPVYARDILRSGPETYGLLVSAFGLGSLLAAFRMTAQLTRWDLRRHLLVGLSVAGVGMVTFAWARVLPLALLGGFLAGFGLILYVSSTNTLLQMTTADRFRGRIMSLYTLMFVGTAPIGALGAGAIAQRWGAPTATTFCALVLLVGALWVSFRLRTLQAREVAANVVAATPEKVG